MEANITTSLFKETIFVEETMGVSKNCYWSNLSNVKSYG